MGLNKVGLSLSGQIKIWAKMSCKHILATKPVSINNSMKRFYYAHPNATIKPGIAYHGSPYDFPAFDMSKIGTGEGFSKRGKGLYLFRTPKFAPYFANIKSADAPLHLGSEGKLKNPTPTIYTVNNLDKLNIKTVSLNESRAIARNQSDFELKYPDIDGIEVPSTEICIFPKSVNKLSIQSKEPLADFLESRKGFPFRTWTTDKSKLDKFT